MSLTWSQISDKYLTLHDNFQVRKFQYNAEKKGNAAGCMGQTLCAIREEQRASTEHNSLLHVICSYWCYTTRKSAVLLEQSQAVKMASLSCNIPREKLFALFLPDLPTLSI